MPQAQTVAIPAGLPIDEVTRNELLDAGRANRSNINVRQRDRLSLEKRLGFNPVTNSRLSAVTRSNGYKLFEHKGVPMVIHRPASDNPMYVDSYVEALSLNVQQSRVPECSYRLLDQPVTEQDFDVMDVAYVNGYVATATGPTVTVHLSDAETGAVISSQGSLAAGDGTATLATFSDRYLVAFVRTISSTSLVAFILDTQNIASGWTTLATVAATTAAGVDVPTASASLTNRVAVAYAADAGTDRLVIKTYNQTGLLETRNIGTTSGTPTNIDINGSIAGTLWVTWTRLPDLFIIGLDADSLASTLATTLNVASAIGIAPVFVVEGPSANQARLVYFNVNPVNICSVKAITTVAGAATLDTSSTVHGVAALSRPWARNGRLYMVACGGAGDGTFGLADLRQTNHQRTCVVVDWTDQVGYWRPLANIEPGLVCPMWQSKVVAVDASRYYFPLSTVRSGSQTLESILSGDTLSGLSLVDLDFGSRNRWQTADFANYTFLSGALTAVYDGRTVTESNFLVRPTKPEASVGGTGITGTYRYVAVFEDVDAAGNWVVSGISDPSDEVAPANETVTVEVPPLTISSRIAKGTVRVAFYRTEDGGEAPYYRLGTVDNDTSSALVSFADDVDDTTLLTRAKLYAPNLPGVVGESLDRRAPPGLVHLTSYNGMLVGAKGESICWSGQEVYGEAPWFSPIFELPVTGGGDITALSSQDGTLFIFKRDRIYAVTGEPQSDNGTLGGFGLPRMLAADVGCVDANSVVVTSLGIFFRSERGFELLNRSQQVDPIGDPIGVTAAAYPVTAAAVLDDRNSLVRISIAEGEAAGLVTGDGIDLVFDLTLKQWVSTDIKRGDTLGEATQSACVVQFDDGWRYAWLGVDGTVYTERDRGDASECLDGTSWVTAEYELAPLKLGLQAEQRIYEMEFLFERHSAAGLTIEVANDFGEYAAVTDDKVWTEAAVLAAGRQVSFRPKPRGEAVQLRVKDTEPAVLGTGRGLSFIGISADIAPEQRFTRGTLRLAASVRR